MIGTLSAVEERTLRVTQPDGSVRDLDLDQIQMIELSLGRGSNVARWLAWGAGIGFLGGALAGGIMYDACPGSTDCGGPVPFVAGLGLVGAVPVGLLGALFGAASRPPERWEHVTIAPLSDWDLEVRVRLSR